MTDSDALRERVRNAFVEEIYEDREAGRHLPLSHYLAAYPGHQELIAREFLALADEAGEARSATDALDQTTPLGSDSEASSEEQALGSFRLIRELGRGGQAVVWLAEDMRLARRVALKVLRAAGPGADQLLARFQREAAVTARLDDPGICPVYEVGFDRGVPWIAMRYIPGRTLSAMLREGDRGEESPVTALGSPSGSGTIVSLEGSEAGQIPAPDTASNESSTTGSQRNRREIDAFLELIERVARSLHVAHEGGIVHRDIKPANIMVTPQGDPVLLDFGIAAAEQEGDAPGLTMSGDAIGTPAYMAPEQVSGRRGAVDRRTDVYALGATLFECVTGRRPFEAASREQLFRAILSDVTPDPSRQNRHVDTDLKVVLQCALDKEKDRRYETALAFAKDLRRVRHREPIAARPMPRLLRLKRWAWRNPGAAAAAIILVIGAVVSGWFAYQSGQSARDARLTQARLLAAAGVDALNRGSYFEALAGTGAALRLEEQLDERDGALRRAALRLRLGALRERMPALVAQWTLPESLAVALGQGLIDPVMAPGEDVIAFTHHGTSPDFAPQRFTVAGRLVPPRADGPNPSLTWRHASADGRCSVGLRKDRLVVLGAEDVRHELLPPPDLANAVLRPFLSRDGKRVVMRASIERKASMDQDFVVFDPVTGERLARWTLPAAAATESVFRSSSVMVSAGAEVRIRDLMTGAALSPPLIHATNLSLSPDSRWLVGWREGYPIEMVGVGREAVQPLEPAAGVWIRSFQFDAGSRFVAASTVRGTTLLWSLDTTAGAAEEATWRFDREWPHPLPRKGSAFSPDGTLLLLAPEREVRVVRRNATKGEPATLPHPESVAAALWAHDGRRVVVFGHEGVVRVWDLAAHAAGLRDVAHGSPVKDVSFSPDGRLLATAGRGGLVRLWTAELASAGPALHHAKPVSFAAWDSTSSRIITTTGEENNFAALEARGQALQVWDAHRGEPLSSLFGDHLAGIGAGRAWFVPGRDRLAILFADRANILDRGLGRDISQGHFPLGWILPELSFTTDGRRYAVLGSRGLRVIDTETGRTLQSFDELHEAPLDLAISSDGRLAVSGKVDGVVVYDLEAGVRLLQLPATLVGEVQVVQLDETRRRLLTASREGACRVFRLPDGRPLGPSFRIGGGLLLARLLPDGEAMVSVTRDGALGIWDVAAGQPVAPVLRLGSEVLCAELAPDGGRLACGRRDGLVTVWSLPEASTRPAAEEVARAEFLGARSSTSAPLEGGGAAHDRRGGAFERVSPTEVKSWHLRELTRAAVEGNGKSEGHHLDAMLALASEKESAAFFARRADLRRRLSRSGIVKDLDAAIAAAPDDATYLTKRALFHQERGRHDLALRDLVEAAEKSDDGIAWLRCALGQARHGDIESARSAWWRAARRVLVPRVPSFFGIRSQTVRDVAWLSAAWGPFRDDLEGLVEDLRDEEHEAELRRIALMAVALAGTVLDEWNQAGRHFAAALREHGDDADAHWGLAVALFAADRRPEGATEVARGLAADPEHVPLLLLDHRISVSRLTPEAFASLERLSRETPYHAEALSLSGRWHLQQGRWDEAATRLGTAIELRGPDADRMLRWAHASAHAEAGNWSAATTAFERATRANPDHLTLSLNWALTAREAASEPELEAALTFVESLLDAGQLGDVPPRHLRMLLDLPLPVRHLREREAELRRIHAPEGPGDDDASRLGAVLLRQGCFREARSWLERARKLTADPRELCWLDLQIALGYAGSEDLEGARAALERGRELRRNGGVRRRQWYEELILERLEDEAARVIEGDAATRETWRRTLQAPRREELTARRRVAESGGPGSLAALIDTGVLLSQLESYEEVEAVHDRLRRLTEGKGIAFDGRITRVEGPFIPLEESRPFTFECWARGVADEMVVYGGPRSGRITIGVWSGLSRDGGRNINTNQTPRHARRGWNHVAIQWDGSHMSVFTNGRYVAYRPAPHPEPFATECRLRMRRGKTVVAAVRASRTARYSEEFEPAWPLMSDERTLLLWDFSRLDGDRVLDLSGNERHGKIIDPWWEAPQESR